MKYLLCAFALLLCSAATANDGIISVVGLFKNVVVIDVDGKRELLRAGQRSKQGILLLHADSRAALVEVHGREVTLTLSQRIDTRFAPVKSETVSIPMNNAGQYQGAGTINGQPVSFLIDTGASIVAMNSGDATRLGIDYAGQGRARHVTTAGGVVKSWAINLDSIQVGGIRVDNVPAAVLKGAYPKQILLGMTFLRNVDMKQSAGVMVLKSKY